MDTAKNSERKNFRCVFNSYVSEFNKDGVIRSIISQFEGYYSEPEVTLTDDGFILSLTLGDNLSPTIVRDKLLWNQFVEKVSAQDAIRKIQIIRLPKASAENEGTVGAFGPHGSNSGVDEVDGFPHMEYKIDMGDRPDGPTVASVRYAHDDKHPWPTTEDEAANHVMYSGHHDEVMRSMYESPSNPRKKFIRNLIMKYFDSDLVGHALLHKHPEMLKYFGIPEHTHDDDPLDFEIPDSIESIGVNASLHYADPTGQMLPEIYGPGAEDGKPVDEDVNSDLTNMHAPTPKVLGVPAFRRVAVDTDAGSAFTLNKPNGFQDVGEPPDQGPLHEKATSATGIGGGAPISGASWYVTQPGNEQQTDLGTERNKTYDSKSSTAPLSGIIASSVVSPELDEEDTEQGIKGSYGATLDTLGVGEHPMGGASYGSIFGLNEFYDYEGDVSDYDI